MNFRILEHILFITDIDSMESGKVNPNEGIILNNMKILYNLCNGNWNVALGYYEYEVKAGDKIGFYSVCDKAAFHGHFEIFKWAHENGCHWNNWVFSNGAENGHLEILKYAHENGCPWDWRTCINAATNGHLEVLKYAHENGCPWNGWTCRNAAGNGHLEILKYACENGCPWDVLSCSYAARNGHLDVLYYLYENKARYSTSWGIHPNCKEFFDIYGEYWKKGDYTYNHSYLKPAKS